MRDLSQARVSGTFDGNTSKNNFSIGAAGGFLVTLGESSQTSILIPHTEKMTGDEERQFLMTSFEPQDIVRPEVINTLQCKS